MGGDVVSDTAQFNLITFKRRDKFRGSDIFLPKVLHREGNDWTELDYQMHILPSITWGEITAPDTQSALPSQATVQSATVDVGDAPPVFHADRVLYIDKTVKVSWFARRLSDIVPNPWQATRITEEMLRQLREAGETDDSIYDQRSSLAFQLREHVAQKLDEQAENAFRRKLQNGEIKFDLESTSHNFKIVDSYSIPLPDDVGFLGHKDGRQLQLNLFEPVHNSQYDSSLERNFARLLR